MEGQLSCEDQLLEMEAHLWTSRVSFEEKTTLRKLKLRLELGKESTGRAQRKHRRLSLVDLNLTWRTTLIKVVADIGGLEISSTP